MNFSLTTVSPGTCPHEKIRLLYVPIAYGLSSHQKSTGEIQVVGISSVVMKNRSGKVR